MKGIHGYLGSGKSLYETMDAYLKKLRGYEVISNMFLSPKYFGVAPKFPPELRIPRTFPNMDIEYLIRVATTGEPLPFERVFILGDEWQYFMDSRTSQDRGQIILGYLGIQSRKRHMIFEYGTSRRGMADNRIRENTDIAVKCFKYHNHSHIQCPFRCDVNPNTCRSKPEISSYKVICYNAECEKLHAFKYVTIDTHNKRGKVVWLWEPKLIYPLYNTYELTSPVSGYSKEAIENAISEMARGQKL